jgi:hypothetical protein
MGHLKSPKHVYWKEENFLGVGIAANIRSEEWKTIEYVIKPMKAVAY